MAPSPTLWKRFKENWAFAIFCIEIVATLFTVLLHPVGQHYIMFSLPARYLWALRNPYGVDFPGGGGWYFYSPACALFFFSWFAWLPNRLGQILYVLVSLSCFLIGLNYLLESIRSIFGIDLKQGRYRHFLWLMIGSEVVGAILATKVELFMVGLLLLSIGFLMRGRNGFLAGLCLALITNWKFQPAPVVGLTLLVLFVFNSQLSTVAAFLFGSLFFYFLPYLFLPRTFVGTVNYDWTDSLSRYMHRDWLANIFQHIYAFMVRSLKIQVNLDTANTVSAFIGLGLAVYLVLWLWPLRRHPDRTRVLGGALLIALGFGSAYVSVFSPLSQSNAYILYTPLLFPVLLLTLQTKSKVWLVQVILTVAYFTISIAYSDLVPRAVYHFLYDSAVKPLGVILLCLWLCFVMAKYRRALLS